MNSVIAHANKKSKEIKKNLKRPGSYYQKYTINYNNKTLTSVCGNVTTCQLKMARTHWNLMDYFKWKKTTAFLARHAVELKSIKNDQMQ